MRLLILDLLIKIGPGRLPFWALRLAMIFALDGSLLQDLKSTLTEILEHWVFNLFQDGMIIKKFIVQLNALKLCAIVLRSPFGVHFLKKRGFRKDLKLSTIKLYGLLSLLVSAAR